MGLVEEPEVNGASLRFSRTARVDFPDAGRGEVLVQVWSDGSLTCAVRAVNGAQSWGEAIEMVEVR